MECCSTSSPLSTSCSQARARLSCSLMSFFLPRSPLPSLSPSLFSYFVCLTQSYSHISMSSLPPLHPPPTLPPRSPSLPPRFCLCAPSLVSTSLPPPLFHPCLFFSPSSVIHSHQSLVRSLSSRLWIIGVLGAADGRVASHFQAVLVESKGCVDPYGPLMKLLTRSSLFVLEKSSALLAKLLTFPLPPAVDSQAEQETPASTAADAHPHCGSPHADGS